MQGRTRRFIHLVDIPGHPKLRQRFTAYADSAQCIVFLVDAVDFMPHNMVIAE